MIKGFEEGVHVEKKKDLLYFVLWVFFSSFFNLDYFLQQERLACQGFSCLVAHEIFKLLFFLLAKDLDCEGIGGAWCCAEQVLGGPSLFNIYSSAICHCRAWAQESRGPSGPGLGVTSPETCHDAPALALEHHVRHFSSRSSPYRQWVSSVCVLA